MKFFGGSLSPYFERSVVLLDIKGALGGVEFPGLPTGGMKSEAHFIGHPYGKIPYLELEDGSSIIEGQVIMEYLDAVTDGPALIPADPLERAKATLIGRILDTYLFPQQAALSANIIFGRDNPDAIKKAVEEGIPRAVSAIERYLGDGEHAIGDSWTTGDAALLPFMFHVRMNKKHFDLDLLKEHKKLATWWSKVEETDIAKNCMKRMQKSFDYVRAS